MTLVKQRTKVGAVVQILMDHDANLAPIVIEFVEFGIVVEIASPSSSPLGGYFLILLSQQFG